MIHPVGIGISSWFWKNLINEWDYNNDMYAPDILGCGKSDAWDPKTKGLFFPLSYVQHIEHLLNSIIKQPCIVITQGAIAPVGIMLASRNPTKIKALILSSPPSYEEMVQPMSKSKLKRNYNFYTSRLGSKAFDLLEKRYAVQFFSKLFLFKRKNNNDLKTWLDLIEQDISIQKREPIKVFNAGLPYHRSFQDDMNSITQPVLILSGDSDTDARVNSRNGYCKDIKSCKSIVLDGRNVLPWESPKETCNVLYNFLRNIP